MNMDDPSEIIARALDSGVRCFIIRGAAGTGKTTLVRSLIPLLIKRKRQPLLMAPTGRAAFVLAKRTGHSAHTVHSAIYNVTDEPEKSKQGDAIKWIFPLKKGTDIEDIAFVVDEASMVGISRHDNDRELFQFGSGSLLGDLVEYSGVRVAETRNLLFFVGDKYQLPPVEEMCVTPPALDERTIEELTGFRPFVIELTTIHRQDFRSGILAEATRLRTALEKNDFNRFAFTWHDDVSSLTDGEALHGMTSLVGDYESIAIAYTNARVRDWNDAIRAKMGLKAHWPVSGDRLISLRNSRLVVQSHQGEEQYQFYNGDLLRVISVGNETDKVEGYYRPKDSNKTYSFSFVFCKMSVIWIGEGERGRPKNIWVNITPIVFKDWDELSQFASLALYNGIKQRVENGLREEYPNFRKNKEDKEHWDTLVRERIADSPLYRAPWVKFGYAVTGHKAQGGEWAQVFADFSRGGSLMNADYFRWAYTVTTRAVRHLYVVNPPQIDSLLTSLKQIAPKSMENTVGPAVPGRLADILNGAGYKLEGIKNLSNRCRAMVSKDGAPGRGFVDFVFNKKERITYIEAMLDGMSQADFAEFLGASVALVTGADVERQGISQNPFAEVRQSHQSCVQRMSEATKEIDLRLVKAQSLTDYHLRLTFESPMGGGELDVYFDAKGRLTNVGNCTLDDSDRQKLLQCFGV